MTLTANKWLNLVFAVGIAFLTVGARPQTVEHKTRTFRLSEVRIRDAFILPDEATKTYYLVASVTRPRGFGRGVSILTSKDLETWQGPFSVFDVPPDFWGQAGVWAPEIHIYKGKYYLFTTFCTDDKVFEQWTDWPPRVKRGSQVLVADSPMGPFRPFHNRSHTPANEMALDGTLWVEDGIPYMVYCHEWVQIKDGAMNVIRLKDDLSDVVGEPVTLFKASEAPWTPPDRDRYVTDGPFLYRTKTGKLLMIWSSFTATGYTTGIAVSKSSKLKGPWIHQPEPLFREDGGHGMIFRKFDGTLMLVLHSPNRGPNERARLFELEDTGDSIRIKSPQTAAPSESARPYKIAATMRTAIAASQSDTIKIASPDGKVQLEFLVQKGHLKYSVSFKDKVVVETSPIAFTLDGIDLTDGVEGGEVKRYSLNETYPWRGVHSQAVNHCNGATISLKHTKADAGGDACGTATTSYTLEARAFNDGVAFRYVIPGDDKARVPDEATAFLIPAESIVWHHDLEGHYEAVHKQNDISELQPGQWIAPPMTFRLPGGVGYASITEAALVNYSGMALQAAGNRQINLVLGHKHHISYPYRLRYKDEIEQVSKPASVSGTITSPWRVVMIGADLNALVNCDIVPNLCPPPDASLFPKGINTDWVKPGRAVWRYLDGGGSSLEDMKEFSRLAGQLGFEYHVIEGFWSRWSDEQIKELVDYSRRQGVGLWFWRHSRQLRTPEAREAFFKRLHDLGVVGAKIDFFDHEHKDVVDHYTALLKDAARYQIMVNFHGANKPTGEPRTWPNELVREAVRGMEASRLKERAVHNATLPFTRYLAGHGDYTPVHFGTRRADTTWAHQIATATVFTSPLLTYGAQPANILKNPAVEMMKSIPAVWDETIVLPVSEIGEVAVFARRSADAWFLAIVNGPAARTINIPLSFLGENEYLALLVRDKKDDPAAVEIEKKTLKRTDSLAIEMPAGGGFIARFLKN